MSLPVPSWGWHTNDNPALAQRFLPSTLWFEAVSPMAHVGIKCPVKLRMALNLWSFCLYLPATGIPGLGYRDTGHGSQGFLLARDMLNQLSHILILENGFELKSTQGLTTCAIALHGTDAFLPM